MPGGAKVLFVGDDWAEDHHDVELVDESDGGWLGLAWSRAWRGCPGCMH
jgi:hypothetical protein